MGKEYILTDFDNQVLRLRVLHEDNHCLVVVKSPQILSQKSKRTDISLLEIVKAWLKRKYNKKGNVFLGVIHRIDKPVCGLVLMAKTSKAASRLAEDLRNHSIERNYLALVEGVLPEPQGFVTSYLSQNAIPKVDVSPFPKRNYKEASLYYKVIRKGSKTTLIDIKLFTGRKHQIRAQMAFLGCPVIGDRKYCASIGYKEGAIGLYSKSIKFIHPTTKDVIYVELSDKEIELYQWII